MPFQMPPMPFPMPPLFITAVKDICTNNTFEKLLKVLFSEVSCWHFGFTTPLFSATTTDMSLYDVLTLFPRWSFVFRVLFFSLAVVVLFNRLHRVYAVWFQILLFTTSERFSTKTLAYLAYKAFKAFMAFKRSRLNLFQNYRSITSFSVD